MRPHSEMPKLFSRAQNQIKFEDEIPHNIYDVLKLDQFIRCLFEKERGRLKDHKKRLKQLSWIQTNGGQMEKLAASKEIEYLKNRRRLLISEETESNYIMEVGPLLLQYEELISSPGDQQTNEERRMITKDLVSDLLDKMGEFMVITIKTRDRFLGRTESYKIKGPKNPKFEDGELSSFDIKRINFAPRYRYTRKVHFRDCFLAYQGDQNKTINPKVYDYLWAKARINGITSPTNLQIFLWLEEGHDKLYTDHYEDINLIRYKMTGVIPDKIQHLEEPLFKFHRELCKGFDSLQLDRSNIINVWYLLWVGLHMFKHPCKYEDFVIMLKTKSDTRDTIESYYTIVKRIFDLKGWKFPVKATWLLWGHL